MRGSTVKYSSKIYLPWSTMVASRFSVRGHEDMRTRGQPAFPTTGVELVVISNMSKQW
jgi:hypothetical protein